MHPAARWTLPARGLLGLALLVALGWWAVLGGGIALLSGVSTHYASLTPAMMSGGSPQGVAATGLGAGGVGYDVNLALQRLRESGPHIYAQLTNPRRPRLSTTNGLPTYTWQYVGKSAKDSATVHKISLTLDSGGRVVGVTGD